MLLEHNLESKKQDLKVYQTIVLVVNQPHELDSSALL